MDKYGKEQVQIWRRSFDVPPPGGESLKMTKERTIPFFLNKVMPFIEKGKNVLITAHGNSLRSIVMNIENLNEQEILKYEIETGKPLFYRWSQNQFTKIL
jgi:2,3-bisphosphoglycerate-dependent phosphoglycerate mutase